MVNHELDTQRAFFNLKTERGERFLRKRESDLVPRRAPVPGGARLSQADQ